MGDRPAYDAMFRRGGAKSLSANVDRLEVHCHFIRSYCHFIRTSTVTVLRAQARNPLPELSPLSQLQGLGLDSLELMEFVFAVEDRFNLRIPESRLDPRQLEITLGDVARAIDDVLATAAAKPSNA